MFSALTNRSIAFLMMGLVLSVLPAQGEPQVEKLKLVLSPAIGDSEMSYSCVTESGATRAQLTVNLDSQWLRIDLGEERGQFSGLATKALYRDQGVNWRALHLSNSGLPYFYEFSLTTDLNNNRTTFSLKFGAIALYCAD